MKRGLLIAGALAAALGGGLWLATRHQPGGALLEEAPSAFVLEARGPGQLFRFQDLQMPLRALRWLLPPAGDLLAAQLTTQSNRQELTLFRQGRLLSRFLLAKPAGVSEGFWRFALLADVIEAPGGTALLLYRAEDPASPEPAVLLALDLSNQEVRWSHLGGFRRMALAEGAEGPLFLYGGKGPIETLPLHTGQTDRGGAVTSVHTLELPPEIVEVEDLLPTTGGAFLAAHRGGLAAYRPKAGWAHLPTPEATGVACAASRAVLARAGRTFWWQPAPGRLLQVQTDGSLVAERIPEGFAAEDPQGNDVRLLRLLGSDGAGALWFTLATPLPPPPAPAGIAPVAGETVEAAPPAGPDWAGYAAQGLDRIYRWQPSAEALERLSWRQAWPALQPPADLPAPSQGPGFRPSSGALLLEGPRSAWRLPLAALPLQRLTAHPI